MLRKSGSFGNRIRQRTSDRLPGQTLKRKKYIFASIILICVGFDWLFLWFCRDAFFMLLCDAPYLPEKYAQEYTHLKTLRTPTDLRHQEDLIVSIIMSSQKLKNLIFYGTKCPEKGAFVFFMLDFYTQMSYNISVNKNKRRIFYRDYWTAH